MSTDRISSTASAGTASGLEPKTRLEYFLNKIAEAGGGSNSVYDVTETKIVNVPSRTLMPTVDPEGSGWYAAPFEGEDNVNPPGIDFTMQVEINGKQYGAKYGKIDADTFGDLYGYLLDDSNGLPFEATKFAIIPKAEMIGIKTDTDIKTPFEVSVAWVKKDYALTDDFQNAFEEEYTTMQTLNPDKDSDPLNKLDVKKTKSGPYTTDEYGNIDFGRNVKPQELIPIFFGIELDGHTYHSGSYDFEDGTGYSWLGDDVPGSRNYLRLYVSQDSESHGSYHWELVWSGGGPEDPEVNVPNASFTIYVYEVTGISSPIAYTLHVDSSSDATASEISFGKYKYANNDTILQRDIDISFGDDTEHLEVTFEYSTDYPNLLLSQSLEAVILYLIKIHADDIRNIISFMSKNPPDDNNVYYENIIHYLV